ncbi:unannotated protein [freshwater metagenome]|uniref:Unannotated protein n=1 Tax=freshwater metagenome TaxID=449393 RepID=A0A6J6SFV3_9ZZZZ
MRLVADAPLAERDVAHVIGPHLRRLQFQPGAATRAAEFLDVHKRLPTPPQAGAVIESLTTHVQANEQPDRGISALTPPPPRLGGGTVVFKFVAIGEHARQTMGVIRYLSLEWLDALTAAVAANDELQRLASEHTLGVTQAVTDGPEGTVVYHLQVGDGTARFGAGSAFPEDVRMEQTWETAVGVATGTINAQEAFIKGRILLTGGQQVLMQSQAVFAALDAVFRTVREHTEYT